MIKHSAYALGATLYMPATRPDILDVVLGEKIQGLRSLVVCLEDAVAEIDVQQGLNNLKNLLLGIEARGGRPSSGPILFVRPRDAAMAAVLNDWSLMRHVDGFVVPKLSLGNIREWQQAVTRDDLMLMPVGGPLTMKELIAVSDGLRREGKLIGVISHGAALKERIAARIQVEPHTGGRSLLSGPGCERL